MWASILRCLLPGPLARALSWQGRSRVERKRLASMCLGDSMRPRQRRLAGPWRPRRMQHSRQHAQREAVFLQLAAREGDPQERKRLLALARHSKGQAKLYRMVERRGTKKPVRA